MTRMGRRHRPFFRINAVDGRTPRDGRIIEKLGHYDPLEQDPDKQVVLDKDKTAAWLAKGAVPSDRVIPILKRLGLSCAYMEQKEQRRARARQIARKLKKPFTKAERITAGHLPADGSK